MQGVCLALFFSSNPSVLTRSPHRWAFVDFHLPEQCTRALLNIHNHTLNGRALVVEYASAEAVRRGGIGTRAAIAANRGGRGGAGGARGGRPAAMPKKGRDWDDADVVQDARSMAFDDAGDEEKATRAEHGFRPTGGARGGRGGARGGARGGRGGARGGGEGKPGVRAKPGAALASAQRASEAIVESQGRKITFD